MGKQAQDPRTEAEQHRDQLLAALEAICDSGVALSGDLEQQMLDAIRTVRRSRMAQEQLAKLDDTAECANGAA